MGEFSGNVIVVTGASEGIGRALCEALAPQGPRLVLAARNAGRTMWARADEVRDTAIFRDVMELNYFSVVWLTLAALPHLKASRGRLVPVASVAGLTGVPSRSAYCASKHAVVGFFDSLRIELADSGVTVTTVCPDFVVTEIHRRALDGTGQPLGTSPMQEASIMTAAECAQLMVPAMAARRRMLITSARGRLGRILKILAPGLIDRIAARAIAQRK